jgi:hypothetical protein
MRSEYFSKRPQQNVPCVIRENDILFMKTMKDTKERLALPSRVILNKNTISLFEKGNIDKVKYAFELKNTEIYSSKNDHCCVIFRSEVKSFEICALGEDCGTKSNKIFYNSWNYSFNMFKSKCYNKLKDELSSKAANLTTPLIKGFANSASSIPMNMDVNEAEERAKLLKEKLGQSQDSKVALKLETSEKASLQVLNREIDIEAMIKNEEFAKAKEATTALMHQMKNEQKKKEKLEQAIDATESESLKMRQAQQIESSVLALKKDTESIVLTKREDLKKKISDIRKRAERRQKMIEQQINLIRGSMTNDLISANKKGDPQICVNGRKSKEATASYCDEHSVDDYNENLRCKTGVNFCNLCCDNEFGKLNMEAREQCYDECLGNKRKDFEGDWTIEKSIK